MAEAEKMEFYWFKLQQLGRSIWCAQTQTQGFIRMMMLTFVKFLRLGAGCGVEVGEEDSFPLRFRCALDRCGMVPGRHRLKATSLT